MALWGYFRGLEDDSPVDKRRGLVAIVCAPIVDILLSTSLASHAIEGSALIVVAG